MTEQRENWIELYLLKLDELERLWKEREEIVQTLAQTGAGVLALACKIAGGIDELASLTGLSSAFIRRVLGEGKMPVRREAYYLVLKTKEILKNELSGGIQGKDKLGGQAVCETGSDDER